MTQKKRQKNAVTRGLVALWLLASSAPVLAQGQDAQTYDMPAQALGAALGEIGTRSGTEIIAPAVLVEGLTAPALRGAYAPDAAVRTLLAGTGLVAERVNGAFVIRRAEAASDSSGDEPIVVTGTRIRGAPIASPVIAVSADRMRAAGQAGLADAMRALPQNFGGGQNPGIGNNVPEASGVDIGGGASLNLRGLGSDATLTLLNGHRLSYSSALQSVDISAIPFDAVDRIEIVADGASALYGSDAVAGVANIILRRDFDGVRTRARWGTSTDGGNGQQQYGLLAGRTWDSGGLMGAYEFSRISPIVARQRSYAADVTPGVTLFPFLKHHNGLVSGHQTIGDKVTLAFDALYNKRWKASIFPLNTAGDLDVSRAENRTRSMSFAIAPALKVDLGSWHAGLSTMYGKDRVHFTIANILGDSVLLNGPNCYCNSATSIELAADGPLFSLPGGSARLAVGGGYRQNAFELRRALAPQLDIDETRDSKFAYAELNLPFVAPAMGVPGVHRLNLSGAVRYEHYPEIDTVVTPKLGLIYAPFAGVTLKGSWGRSFRAPTFLQLYQSPSATLVPASRLGGTATPGATALLLIGGNTALAPERARTWSASVVLEPAIAGARLELGWFETRYRNRIVTPIVTTAQALADPAYADLVSRDPDAGAVNAAINSVDSFFNSTGGDFDPASVTAIVNNRYVNAGHQTIRGLDALASYETAMAGGTLGLTLNATWLESTQRRTVLQPEVALAGRLFNPPHWRARAGANWSKGPLGLNAHLNYTGGVTDVRQMPADDVDGMTTIDLAVRFETPRGGGLLGGLEFVLAAENVLNARPDPIRTTLYYDTPYDSTNYSAVGRFISLGVSKTW